MEVVLEIKKGKGSAIIKEIKECKRKFLNFQKLERYAEHQNNTKHFVLVTYGVDHLLSHNDVEKLKTRYAKINNVQCVTINQATNEFRSNISTKNCWWDLARIGSIKTECLWAQEVDQGHE